MSINLVPTQGRLRQSGSGSARTEYLAQLQSVSNSADAHVSDAAIQGAKVTFALFARLLTKPRDSAPV
jgi:hypothetical protein